MAPKFNIDRPKVSDEEIRQHQNFEELVKQFKKQSLKQARGDESWRKNKKIRYTTIIAGVTVICTITLFALYANQKTKKANETVTTNTHSSPQQKQANSTGKRDETGTVAANGNNGATNTKGTTRFIAPPSPKLRIANKSYKVNNASGGTIQHPSSTRIKVPKGAFVDKAGRDIVGDVTIEYREFHDAADIILSGIPMAYDSAGHRFNLETAGMFEITGSQNGEPVFIKPDKKVDVELASRNAEQRFNQYYLDTVARNWNYLKRDVAKPVARKSIYFRKNQKSTWVDETPQLTALDRDIRYILPKKVDSVKVVYTRKIAQLPKYKTPTEPKKFNAGRPTFNLDGSYDEFPELASFKNVLFEVGPENNNYSKKMHEITWSDVKVSEGPVKGKNFWLTLTYRSMTEKLVVYPVLNGKDYETAREDYNERFEEYSRLQTKKEEDEKRLLAEMQKKQQAYLSEIEKKKQDYELQRRMIEEASRRKDEENLNANFDRMDDVTRASRLFSVSRFGVYNSDCPRNFPTKASVSPIFAVSNGNGFIQAESIFLVDHTQKSVFSLNPKAGPMHYDPDKIYSVCALSQGRLFICDKESFKSAIEGGSNKFAVKQVADDQKDIEGFRKALEL